MRISDVKARLGGAAAACAAAFALLAGPAAAATLRPVPTGGRSLRLETVEFKLADGSTLSAQQGTFQVPENRGVRGSRLIPIVFVRLPSTSPHPGPPIVYLAGGPGGSGVDAAHGPRQPIFLALRQVADVIALDQRGTGLSNRIAPCKAPAALDPARPLNETDLTAYHRTTLTRCLVQWRAAGVDPLGYTTEESAADIEALRQALGAPKVDLWAISYGTHLALAAMRRRPGAIGRVALASAEGLGQTVKSPSRVDAAFGRLGKVLAADPNGRGYGDLSTLMRHVHARLDAKPLRLETTVAGAPAAFTMDSFALRMIAGGVVKNPGGLGRLAMLYTALDKGVTAPFAPLFYRSFYGEPLAMTGMAELMDIASGVGDQRLAEIRTEAPASLLGTAVNFPMPQLRRAVTGLDLGDAWRQEVRSAIPTLLVSGDLDVRTPLEEQADATRGLSRLERLVVHNAGHDVYETDPRITARLVAFFKGEKTEGDQEITIPPPHIQKLP